MILEKPDVLYFLFLLIIPILVHLFQLRKFKTTKFSNVALLEKIIIQSRKSSVIKKWLTLIARLLALAFLILAFAKPFLPNTSEATKPQEVFIFLDNSYSMALPGKRNNLLEESKQSLLENLDDNQKFSLATNNNLWQNVTKKDIRAEIFDIDFTTSKFSFQDIILKANSVFSKSKSQKHLFLISDFLNFDAENIKDFKADFEVKLIQKTPENYDNYFLESATLANDGNSKTISALVKKNQNNNNDITVSIFNEGNLIAKNRTDFGDKNRAEVNFDIGNQSFKNGKISIENDNIAYDNDLFFSINDDQIINIISIYDEDEAKNNFLKKIFRQDQFNFKSVALDQFNFTEIENANVLILNEIENINTALKSNLKRFADNNGSLVVIPNQNNDLENFRNIGALSSVYLDMNLNKQNITTINFEHPILENVFSERIENFDYPSTEQNFKINNRFNNVLSYSNNDAFLAEKNNTYVFASALNPEASNFINSPIVVPVFYNIAQQSVNIPQLYATIGEENTITVNANLGSDEVLKLSGENSKIIPQQSRIGNSIEINTQYNPKKPGNYKLTSKDSTLLHLSFNFDRSESEFNFINTANFKFDQYNSVEEVFDAYSEMNKIIELWFWMLIFALGFFIIELLLLRFLK
ncbi:BatA domain-containing protein [Psychroflexus aestuariivivens]|uniref:BatA domain-containing protein n=1 Tax=Psychroflexus aestuariivivens TaxID=1795040 RepID=UPI000FD7A3F2|nr:BatA domain-containing protein [Psychroflexus aestuariivivens]